MTNFMVDILDQTNPKHGIDYNWKKKVKESHFKKWQYLN